jgi:protein phosphatase
VKLLTIGEFARAAKLSPKALRLYDELGLLRPHAVDKWSGYRYYTPEQLEKARLAASLRQLDMPLARIREVVDLAPAEAAAAVAAFAHTTEAEFAERRRLAQLLIGNLCEGTTAMTTATASAPLDIRYAAGSDRGSVRERNQDVAYAGPVLLAIAEGDQSFSPALIAVTDGFGPHGEQASALVIDALRGQEPSALFPPAARDALAAAPPIPADVLDALSSLTSGAATAVRSLGPRPATDDSAADDSATASASGSTLTAMYWTGSQLALVHIGDSRAYLLRDGGLFQLTHDDSVAQAMVDAGQLTPEEAASHPQRSLLVKAIGAAGDAQTPTASWHDARPGDRYLLTTDGLTAAVPVPAVREVLRDAALSPQAVVDRLIALANEAGGPDNIACAVADVIHASEVSDRSEN